VKKLIDDVVHNPLLDIIREKYGNSLSISRSSDYTINIKLLTEKAERAMAVSYA
jgi:hypothetical protein